MLFKILEKYCGKEVYVRVAWGPGSPLWVAGLGLASLGLFHCPQTGSRAGQGCPSPGTCLQWWWWAQAGIITLLVPVRPADGNRARSQPCDCQARLWQGGWSLVSGRPGATWLAGGQIVTQSPHCSGRHRYCSEVLLHSSTYFCVYLSDVQYEKEAFPWMTKRNSVVLSGECSCLRTSLWRVLILLSAWWNFQNILG